jgi:hypothetical protein
MIQDALMNYHEEEEKEVLRAEMKEEMGSEWDSDLDEDMPFF